jgi:hypothetical protein
MMFIFPSRFANAQE